MRFGTCGLVAGALLAFQPAAMSSTASLVQQSNALSMRPLPTLPAPATPRSDLMWVPDRWVPTAGAPGLVQVPGHWEQRLSDRESFVPPLVISHPQSGAVEVVPAGVRTPVESRTGP